MDLNRLIKQVKYNCNVSDARFWGYYSICGLLLRMREIYRNEKGMMPWEKIPSEDISLWIGDREKLWKELEKEEFQPLEIDGKSFGPFDVEDINRVLNKRGLLYGGGYSTFGKPSFFLAQLKEKKELYDYTIYFAEKELCRDLSTSIAMLQGICIFLRTESLRSILWEKIQEMKCKRFESLLDRAFALYEIKKGVEDPKSLYQKVEIIAQDIADIFVFHEIGEAVEDRYGFQWRDVTGTERWTELHLRGIKDMLADTTDYGPLRLIIEKKDERLLFFYLLFFDSIRKTLFPEIIDSFQRFLDLGDWDILEEARIKGYRRARSILEEVAGIIENNRDLSSLNSLIKKSLEKVLNIKS